MENSSQLRVDEEIEKSQGQNSIQRDASRSMLSKSNIGAQSMQKLTQVASRAALSPNHDMMAEVMVCEIRASSIILPISYLFCNLLLYRDWRVGLTHWKQRQQHLSNLSLLRLLKGCSKCFHMDLRLPSQSKLFPCWLNRYNKPFLRKLQLS